MLYFRHDTDAATDDKMVALRLEHGGAAVDCYWAILEQIYREETDWVFGRNQVGTKSLCHRLCIGFDELEAYVSTMLEIGILSARERTEDAVSIYSERAEAEIETYQARAETARQNGKKGGRKPKRKPSRNRVGTESVTKSEPTGNQDAGISRRRSYGLSKDNPIASAGARADADEPAPRACAWVCPRCGSTAYPDGDGWKCPKHGSIPAADPAPVMESSECPASVLEAVRAERAS